MLSSDLRSIYESYQSIYEEGDGISCEMIEEVVEELIEEYLEFGHNIDEAADVVEQAALQYLMELNPYAPAGSKDARAYQKSTTATKRGEARKTAVAAAKERVKSKVKGAVAAAGIAGSIAKDEARRAGRAAAHAVSSTVQKKKAEVKSGVKGLIGRGLRKAAGAVGKVAQKAAGAASRLGEDVEMIDEGEGSYGQTPKARTAMGKLAISRMHKPATEYSQRGEKTKKVKAAEKHTRRQDNLSQGKSGGKKSLRPRYSGGRGNMDADERAERRAERAFDGENTYGAGSVTKNPKKLRKQKAMGEIGESFDLFDVVLEFLQVEGFAETLEEAEWMMANIIDEEAIDIILEAQAARNNPEKYEGEQAKKSAPVRGEKTPMPPRGDKRREDFEKWYAKNVR